MKRVSEIEGFNELKMKGRDPFGGLGLVADGCRSFSV